MKLQLMHNKFSFVLALAAICILLICIAIIMVIITFVNQKGVLTPPLESNYIKWISHISTDSNKKFVAQTEETIIISTQIFRTSIFEENDKLDECNANNDLCLILLRKSNGEILDSIGVRWGLYYVTKTSGRIIQFISTAKVKDDQDELTYFELDVDRFSIMNKKTDSQYLTDDFKKDFNYKFGDVSIDLLTAKATGKANLTMWDLDLDKRYKDKGKIIDTYNPPRFGAVKDFGQDKLLASTNYGELLVLNSQTGEVLFAEDIDSSTFEEFIIRDNIAYYITFGQGTGVGRFDLQSWEILSPIVPEQMTRGIIKKSIGSYLVSEKELYITDRENIYAINFKNTR